MKIFAFIMLFIKAFLACISFMLLMVYAVEALARLLMAWGYGG